MDPQKWRNVKYIFTSALEQPAGALGAFLDQACGADLELRAEVNRLLVEHFNAGDFLEQPLVRSAASAAPEALSNAQPPPADSRFQFRRRLGSGGFGEVYEVFDCMRNAVVALKYLRRCEPDHLYRLKNEFRTLSDVRHPNLIHVYELFSSSMPPFYTMELLKGHDFGEHMRQAAPPACASSPYAYQRLRACITQLARGVLTLHESQLLHRDIKPSNVFVTDAGRVVLLDFGLVKHLGGNPSRSTLAVAGTPHYLAPEQLDGAALTPATDWYAVGVLFFEALTGRKPFEGSVVDVLSRKRTEEPPHPSAVVANIPSDLDELCYALLRRDPSARPSGEDILRQLEAGATNVATNTSNRSTSTRIFVGRDPVLLEMQRAFEEADAGSGVCVHVRGASGVGKTRLIRTFLDRIRQVEPTSVVLSGRCYESEAAPHKGLDELIDRLALFLKGLDETRTEALLPRYFVYLTRLFPVLQQFRPASRAVPEIPDPREQRHRAFASLRECLKRISEWRPLILWIDDLQWADSDTVRLLNELVQASEPFRSLVLLSYRDTDVETNPVLSSLDLADRHDAGAMAVRLLPIDNLSFDEARNLALALLHDREGRDDWMVVATAIARESRGNPFFVTALVHYVVAMPNRRDLSAGAFGIAHVIKRRLGLLPDPALRLLELVAVAGQPLPSDICASAALLGEQYLEIRSILTRERLLRTHITEHGEELDVYHDQVRAAVTGSLTHEATLVYHAILAQALEESGSKDFERLALHYEAAGNRERARKYTISAADRAIEALAFERAARLFARALDLLEPTDPGRPQIQEQLGAALSNSGHGREAAETFLLASEQTEPVRRLDLRRRACEQYLRSGHLDEGSALMKSLLREVDLWYPQHRGAAIASLLWHRFRLRQYMMRGRNERRPALLTAVARMKLDVAWTVAVGMSMVDVVRGADFQARYTFMALKSGEPSRVALGLAAELAMGSMEGRRSRDERNRLFTTAVRLATENQNPYALAFANSMMGVASWIVGDWSDCYEKNQLAATIFREKCSGVGWELTTANTFVLSSLVFLGRWREHAVTFPDLIQQADARGDRYGAVSLPLLAYTYVHSLKGDRPAEAHAMIRTAISAWPYRDFQIQHCDALLGEVETHLYEGNAQAASEALRRDFSRLKQSPLLQIQFYRLLITALQGRVALALALASGHTAGDRHIREAHQCARKLLKQKPTWANALGNLLRAGIATAECRGADATHSLHAAAAQFEATQMDHYLAVCRFRLAQLQPHLVAQRNDAHKWMSEQGVVNVGAIADVFAPGLWEPIGGSRAE